ncbi:hypothetical protein M3Y99_00851200 [Aphelenchoides fujianensis]|nr:hypothetical protein M3Y99_00851200 [Aphelenchoides fujianensis]
MRSAFLLLFLFCSCEVNGYFSGDFYDFLIQTYGETTADRLERKDLGENGSFGGRDSPIDQRKHLPIVFVHGTTMSAGDFAEHLAFFGQHGGFTEGEVFATTYGDAGRTPFKEKTMDCADVKQIRDFIQAVAAYTNSSVHILAFSMGVANDTNAPAFQYEGRNLFVFRSDKDRVLGTECGRVVCGATTFANRTLEFNKLDHGDLLFDLKDLQLSLLNSTRNEQETTPKKNSALPSESFGVAGTLVYLIQFKSTSNMKDMRFYLTNFVVFDAIFTFILGVLFQPMPVTPIFASSVRGFALLGGVDFSRYAAASAVYGGSTVICAQDLALMYRFAVICPDRRVHAFFSSIPFKIAWAVFSQSLSIALAVAFYRCFISEAKLSAYLATQPNITIPLIPNEVIICVDVHEWFSKAFLLTIVGLFGFSQCLCFTFIYLILRTLRAHSQNYSPMTRKLHYQFLTLLTVQLLTPVFLIVLPVSVAIGQAIATQIPSTLAVQLGYCTITLYGATNAAFCIWFVGPYRVYFKETFILPWLVPLCRRLKIRNTITDPAINNLASTTAQLDPRSSMMF